MMRSVLVTAFGHTRRATGNTNPSTVSITLKSGLVGLTPFMGWISPGRNIKAALKGNANKAFSVSPFTRPHIDRPLASVPEPLT